MKTITVLLLSGAVATQAALIPFAISPAGTSTAVGLSPSNVVPPTASSGSGGEIPGSLIFDDSTFTLHLAVGYGSSQGFTDLTGPAIGTAILGPAQTNENAGVLYDLASLNTPAADPAQGGFIAGDVQYATNDVASLLAGLDYISVATTNYPDGEIRGQLIPLDIPPVLECPEDTNVPCGTSLDLTAGVYDTVGNSVDVVWSLNGVPVQTNFVPAFVPASPTNVVFSGVLPSGTNVIGIHAINAAGSSASCSATIVEIDTNPPVIVSASPSKSTLWPPNHKMVKVSVSAVVADNCSMPTWKIIGVTCNEDVNAKGSGHTAPDWQILDDHSLNLRAERSGKGSGRIYTISIQAVDSVGNLSVTNTVTVTVPHDQSNKDKGRSGNTNQTNENQDNGSSNNPGKGKGNNGNPGKGNK